MKKKLSIILIAIFLLNSTVTAFASEKEITISYNGEEINKSILSQETIEWLEWYNCLPNDVKLTVNYVPKELSISSSLLYEVEKAKIEINNIPIYEDNSNPKALELLPTGGYEAVYNPDYWNSGENVIRANCYAYALELLYYPNKRLNPGELPPSGTKYDALTESSIFNAVQRDIPYTGDLAGIRRAGRNDVPGKNQYKVALAIAPGYDYHWYVQNSNGYWSHKRGFTNVSCVDASGNRIVDPFTCNRNYGEALNYSSFCGYYIITRKG